MAKFLIDENLSPTIAFYLRGLGFKAKAVRELGLKGKSDEEILNYAEKHGFLIITGDLEFGKFFYERLGEISMIVVRSRFQSLPAVLKILEDLHRRNILKELPFRGFLVIASPSATRIREYEK